MKGVVFVATSLDGFIARTDGSIDWLDRATAAAPKGEDFGYAALVASVDAIVMGRRTYELVRSFGGPWPYGATRVVVLGSNPIEIPDTIADTVSTMSGEPTRIAATLAGDGVRRAYVDGGVTIQRFLRAGLIDEITITVIPVLLGEGRPLFGTVEHDVALEHLETRSWDCGFVQSKYVVRR